jgi:hypothetical protein
MNIETGQVKKLSELTDEERASAKYREVPEYFNRLKPKARMRELKRLDYLAEVARKKKEGINR